MKRRVISAVCLTIVVYGIYLFALPGPPMRVQLSAFASLLVGFTAPALIVGSLREHIVKFWRTALLQLAGCLVLELLFSVVIAQWEFGLLPILTLTALGFVCLEGLLIAHAILLTSIARLYEKKEKP